MYILFYVLGSADELAEFFYQPALTLSNDQDREHEPELARPQLQHAQDSGSAFPKKYHQQFSYQISKPKPFQDSQRSVKYLA